MIGVTDVQEMGDCPVAGQRSGQAHKDHVRRAPLDSPIGRSPQKL